MTSDELVEIARLNAEMGAARGAGDLSRLRQLLLQKRKLLEGAYGSLAK
jgi:hypothetical protein